MGGLWLVSPLRISPLARNRDRVKVDAIILNSR